MFPFGRIPFTIALLTAEAVLILGGIWHFRVDFVRALDDRAHFTQIQAHLLAEHASAALLQTELALRSAARELGGDSIDTGRSAACAALSRTAVTVPAIANALIIGPGGDLICALPGRRVPTLDAQRITRLHRDHLAEFDAGIDPGSGEFAMSVRLEDSTYRYVGAAVATVAPGYFASRFGEYGDIDIDLVVLYDHDGTVIARWPDGSVNREAPSLASDIGLLRNVPERDLLGSGLRTYRTSDIIGSLFKLPDYPYRVIVAYARDSVVSRWLAAAVPLIATLALLVLTIAGAALWLRRSILAEFATVRALDASRAREREERIRRLQALHALSGGLAHEINNQMMVVLGSIDVLGRSRPCEEVDAGVIRIRTAAERASRLASRMLAAAGGVAPDRIRCDLDHLARRFAVDRAAVAPGSVTIQPPPVGEPVWVDADPSLIVSALANLVDNAIESLEATGGTVTITVDLLESTSVPDDAVVSDRLDPGRYARVTVSDDGPGMDDETLGRILDPFFSTRFLGRGLGLAVVVGIARQHGGVVVAQSERGRGTVVSIVLPVANS
ncbi:MAG: hypothetical protein EA382_19255 [Spirochaetaceae bacterium]|nr:MAG: hypothetical protein EA382_19255 [Spirochaetaceae bacterium]